MPIFYKGYDKCQKCGKRFKWVHFEFQRSELHSGIFHVEAIPPKPWAREFKILDEKCTEYVVECPHCRFINRFISDTEL